MDTKIGWSNIRGHSGAVWDVMGLCFAGGPAWDGRYRRGGVKEEPNGTLFGLDRLVPQPTRRAKHPKTQPSPPNLSTIRVSLRLSKPCSAVLKVRYLGLLTLGMGVLGWPEYIDMT